MSDQDWGNKIYSYRQRNLITQKELAQILGVSTVCISRWEQSHFEPTMKTKRKLKTLFEEVGMKLED